MPEINFSEKDTQQITGHGLTTDKVRAQIDNFIKGFGHLPVESAAGIGSGIAQFDENGIDKYVAIYDRAAANLNVVKFVPASGAATRMFKDLFEFVNTGKNSPAVDKTVAGIKDFAFYPALPDGVEHRDEKTIISQVLDYGARLPKGLIYFHSYPEGSRTAFEEHLVEGAMYARSGDTVKIHFTISEEHRPGFTELLDKVKEGYEKRFGVRYEVSFSVQDSGTDTVAVTPGNELFRNDDGSLLFRPAGHGALIENLNRLDGEVIFIKNIDNVTTDALKGDTVRYKKLIGGLLLDLKSKADALTARILAGGDAGEGDIDFIENSLMCKLPRDFGDWDGEQKRKLLLKILRRPMRVCGMVRNEGEPGGGPFWVKNPDGTTALQIAEPSQIAPEKAHLLKEGTHFNPVDLVCSVRDHEGRKFDLREFTDPATGFISEKTKDGRPLKAQEHPGLWNGAMAEWITVFAEVPVSTFTPVKEVTDLLKPQHKG